MMNDDVVTMLFWVGVYFLIRNAKNQRVETRSRLESGTHSVRILKKSCKKITIWGHRRHFRLEGGMQGN